MFLIVDETDVFWVEVTYFQFGMLRLVDIGFLLMIVDVFCKILVLIKAAELLEDYG